MFSDFALVLSTLMVWEKQFLSTKKILDFDFEIRLHKVIASAAAVASSSKEALEISRSVRSVTMVWKLSNASSLPCDISDW